MTTIVLVPFEMQNVANDFDRKAAELERAAQAVQSPALVAGLPPGNQATIAAQLRGVAGQLRGIATQQRAIANDLRRRARVVMNDQAYKRLLRDGGAIALRRYVEHLAAKKDKKEIAALEAKRSAASRAYSAAKRNRASKTELKRLAKKIGAAERALRQKKAALADDAFEAATKASSKIKNTAFESFLKLGSSWSGNPLLDTMAKINKLRRDIPENVSALKKAWRKTDPLKEVATSKGVRKLPIVSTATLPWAASDARKALEHDKYKGTLNKVEQANDVVNAVGVGTQTVGAGIVAAGAAASATGVGAIPGLPSMAVGVGIVGVGESIQLVSLGADVGMVVWDKQKEVVKAWHWVNPLD